jgi:methylated-DNA-[protein]-cysteine S-methyltransferase
MNGKTKTANFESHIRRGQIVEGMTFNQKAWAMCARVPKGKVTTYAAIARGLGSPKASRAVGNAMNKNPYAPGVPCHRVVGTSGALTGYAGGLPKKAKMLEDEGVEVRHGKRVSTSEIFRP